MTIQIKIFRGQTHLEEKVNEFCGLLNDKPHNYKLKDILFPDSDTCVVVFEDHRVRHRFVGSQRFPETIKFS